MSSIVTQQGILHYEVMGRGKPLLLLHGWLESWRIWHDTMEFLSQQYRTYALDFWGFGESDTDRTAYRVDDFVEMVRYFMEHLGIRRAPIVGHSMGGTVALALTIRYPDKVERTAVVGSPIVGTSLAWFLRLAGNPSLGRLIHRFSFLLKVGVQVVFPLITPDPLWPERLQEDLSQTDLVAFFESIGSLHEVDLRPDLPKIKTPVLGIYGARDPIVDPNQWLVLKQGVLHAQIERPLTAGHFPMLEIPASFNLMLQRFLTADDDALLVGDDGE